MGFGIRIDQDRGEPTVHHGQDSGDEGIGRDHHAIAFLENTHLSVGHQNQTQGIQATAYTDTMLAPAVAGVLTLKGLNLLSADVPTPVNNAPGCEVQFVAVAGMTRFQVEKRDHRLGP